jgi:hypothetical protein
MRHARNMKEPNPRGKSNQLAPTEREKLAAERFIKLAGSKRRAKRLIDDAETKGQQGRPLGQPYLQVDAQIIWLVAYLQREWKVRSGTIPKRHALIKSVVELCWRNPAGRLSVGRDLLRCGNLGGADEERAVIKRVLGRKLLWAAIADQKDAVRQAHAQARFARDANEIAPGLVIKTEKGEQRVKTYSPPLELFEALHQQQPKLRLLPAIRRVSVVQKK